MTITTFHPESTPNGAGYRFYGPDSVWRTNRHLDHAGYPTNRWDLYWLRPDGAGAADWVLWAEGYRTRREAGADAFAIDGATIRARTVVRGVRPGFTASGVGRGSHPNHRGGSCDRCAGVPADQWPPLDTDVPARVPTPTLHTLRRWEVMVGGR
jgi:hypothetical protein